MKKKAAIILVILIGITLLNNVIYPNKKIEAIQGSEISIKELTEPTDRPLDIDTNANTETERVMLKNIIAEDQHPNYPTGCESVALHILLSYYGINAAIDDIVEALPKGQIPYEKNGKMYGANPETKFVGDPSDINSYGVYNKPIAEVANKFKKGAIAKNGMSLDEIKEIIASGNPVIAWVNIKEDMGEIVVSRSWYDIDTGEEVYWIRGEHAVVVYGYDDSDFYISNPYNGKKYAKSFENFEYYYSAMGERVVYYM